MQSRHNPTSAARWNSRGVGPLPTAKNSLNFGTGILDELEGLTTKLGLGTPCYKVAGGTQSGRGYFCSVNIRGHHAGSLDEYITQEQAKCAAAQNAINLLKQYYATNLAAGQCFQRSTSDKEKTRIEDTNEDRSEKVSDQTSDDFEPVVENLLILLEKMPRGIYSHALSAKYLDSYKQHLPGDWLSRIKEGYPEFVVDEVDTFRSIVAKRPINKGAPKRDIKPPLPLQMVTSPTEPPVQPIADSVTRTVEPDAPKEEPILPANVTATMEKKEKDGTKEEIAISHEIKVRFNEKVDERYFSRVEGEEDHEIIQPPPFEHPPSFGLPDDSIPWNVFVSVVKTPADFMVRLLGEEYSEQYEQLQREMQLFYEVKDQGRKLIVSTTDTSANESLVGGVYAARAEECWHRVYLNEIIPADEGIADEGVTASVYFIDHGDYETVSFEDLRMLEQKFKRLPCQAAPACVAGFEKFALEDFTQDMIDRFRDMTLGKVLPSELMGMAEWPNCVTDGGTTIVGPMLLLLNQPVIEGGNENTENTTNAIINTTVLINGILMQMTPANSVHKIVPIGNGDGSIGKTGTTFGDGAARTVASGQK